MQGSQTGRRLLDKVIKHTFSPHSLHTSLSPVPPGIPSTTPTLSPLESLARLLPRHQSTHHLQHSAGGACKAVSSSTCAGETKAVGWIPCSALLRRGTNGAHSTHVSLPGVTSPASSSTRPWSILLRYTLARSHLSRHLPHPPTPLLPNRAAPLPSALFKRLHYRTALPWNPLRLPPSKLSPSLKRHVSSSTTARASAAVSATAGASAGAAMTASTSPLVAGSIATQRAVAGWILGCAAWTFAMVVLGGVTRLTRSGLSMTEWKFTGERPPLSQEDWEREFARYQQFPEYKRVNQSISLEEFKWIYWMEYAHRMWGRALGVLFAVPFTVFLLRRSLSKPLISRLLLLFGLGGAQGFVGWWMVKSGLEEPDDEHKEPRVSPYRLAAHLTSAFLIYSLLIWTGLTVAIPTPAAETAGQLAAAARARGMAHGVAALVGITAVSGAFVAGNDAGRAYNTFPLMGDSWIPPTRELFPLSPPHRNLFESTALVQLQHRVLALSSLAAVGALYFNTLKLPLHPVSKLMVSTALGVTALQVTLGISTLLSYVPVSLGSAHQAGALTLFTTLLVLLHTLRRPRPQAATKLADALKT